MPGTWTAWPTTARSRRAVCAQRLDAGDARGEKAALGVDHVELAGDAVGVAQPRQAGRVGQCIGACRLRIIALARARLNRKRSACLAERGLDGLLVLRDERALPGR